MKVLIAGGTGFMGSALARLLQSSGHEVWILTRRKPGRPRELQWDGQTVSGWSECISEMDAVVNTTGYGLEHWPWTAGHKRRFIQSRVLPGLALSAAIQASKRRPAVFVQISGINYYGAKGAGVADESSPAARDYLAELTVQWEGVTRRIERLGVRRVRGAQCCGAGRARRLVPSDGASGPLGSWRPARHWKAGGALDPPGG